MFSLFSSLIGKISETVPPGFLLTLLVVPISNYKYLNIYKNEFIGTLLMIGLTFSPGKWIFADSLYLAWAAHSIGVIAADKLGGGQNVNPAMSVAMWSLGKCDYTEMYVRIAGAMGGGLVAFPLFKAMTDMLGWTALGGPEFHPEKGDDDGSIAARSEFFATMMLGFLVYIVNWELNFGKYHYWIKQALTSWGIRALIETFPTAGPAMNPMLGTCWAVFANGGIPQDFRHYFVYWFASIMGVLVSAFLYSVYDGCKFFGRTLPIGPINGPKKVSIAKKES